MKLIARYNRSNLVATIAIFLLSGIAFYFLLHWILTAQLDDDLRLEQNEIENYVKIHDQLPEVIPVRNQFIRFGPATSESAPKFSTARNQDAADINGKYYRELSFTVLVKNKYVEATVGKSTQQSREIAAAVITIVLITILMVLGATIVINRLLLRKLWSPFYTTLNTLNNFKITQDSQPAFATTPVEEFTLMNNILERVTGKARKDFIALKEFTENAAHELQTPLAIIQSQLENLIQDEHLSQSQSMAVQAAGSSLKKLSRINKSLLLLAKIENRQFANVQKLNITQLLEQKLAQFKELWEQKNLAVSADLRPAIKEMNPELADVLLNNLIGNAFRHADANGSIHVSADNKALAICNVGPLGPLDEHQLFSRFYKTTSGSYGNGLGLAIIKQICEVSGWTVHYHYHNAEHWFTVDYQGM